MKKLILRTLAVIGIVLILFVAYIYIGYSRFTAISEGETIPAYENPVSALLVIDIQEGTSGEVSASTGLKRQAEPFIKNVNKAIQTADSLEKIIVYIYHENTHWFANLVSNGTMAKGSPGTAIDKRVNVITENIFSKDKTDGFTNPELDKFLRKKQVKHLYITGLDAAYCVNGTSHGALNRGYKVSIIQDAVISEKEETKEEMIIKFKEAGMELTDTENWLN
jgi:nicotinamidase/pyrazinamidase